MENSSFVQVMKDWHRMCKAMTDRKPNNACDGCPLEPYGCSPVYEAIDSYRDVDFEVVDETIRAWAAEHPEPVYPRWGEWLAERGELSENWKKIQVVSHDSICGMMLEWFNNPIPADIAEKLGIEPKEGI